MSAQPSQPVVLALSYRRHASPLHAARTSAALCWFAALGLAMLLQSNPVVLGALLAVTLAAARGAGAWPVLRRTWPFALAMGLAVCVINALAVRDGLTVIWRFGDIPVFGQVNVTLEATVYGAIWGMRAAALILLGVLFSCCVDPDGLLALMRRVSFGSALSAAIATRMVPVLLRDSQTLSDAQRCRSGRPPSRLALLQATTAGVLDRALDLAATLEVRGYSLASSEPGSGRRWWRRERAGSRHRRSHATGGAPHSRHDIAFTASAAALTVVAVGARIADVAPFHAYPTLDVPAGAGVLVLALVLAVVALAPFTQRRGVQA